VSSAEAAAATEDWEATCTIYDSASSSSILDNTGSFVMGDHRAEVQNDVSDHVFCRKASNDHSSRTNLKGEYDSQIKLLSQQPHSFPRDDSIDLWLE